MSKQPILHAADKPNVDPQTIDAIKQIVLGTNIARSVAIEDPDTIPGITAARIWDNLSSYFLIGDWPDRRRTAAEIEAELESEDGPR